MRFALASAIVLLALFVAYAAASGIYGGQSGLAAAIANISSPIMRIPLAPPTARVAPPVTRPPGTAAPVGKTSPTVIVSPQPLTDVSGMYDVKVVDTVSLATAGTSITKAGGTVLFGLQYLHALAVRATPDKAALLVKDPNVQWVVQERATSLAACALPNPSGTMPDRTAPNGQKPPPIKVAIVDHGNHGNLVAQTYANQCASIGAACTQGTSVAFYDYGSPDGSLTTGGLVNAVLHAISDGANVVNISSVGCGNADCTKGAPIDMGEIWMFAQAAKNNVVIVTAAGNSPGFVNPYGQSGNSATQTVIVGGIDPWNPYVPDSAFSENANIFAKDVSGNGNRGSERGTSFATPRVTAAIAADMRINGTNAAQAVARLRNSCIDMHTDASNVSTQPGTFGYGPQPAGQWGTPSVTVICDGPTCGNEAGGIGTSKAPSTPSATVSCDGPTCGGAGGTDNSSKGAGNGGGGGGGGSASPGDIGGSSSSGGGGSGSSKGGSFWDWLTSLF